MCFTDLGRIGWVGVEVRCVGITEGKGAGSQLERTRRWIGEVGAGKVLEAERVEG